MNPLMNELIPALVNEWLKPALPLVLAAIAGGLLGAIFFGGLWWTVRKSLGSAQPALWLFASLLVRSGVVLAGFYVVAGVDWQRWLACLAGFLVARLIVTYMTRSREVQANQSGPKGDASCT